MASFNKFVSSQLKKIPLFNVSPEEHKARSNFWDVASFALRSELPDISCILNTPISLGISEQTFDLLADLAHEEEITTPPVGNISTAGSAHLAVFLIFLQHYRKLNNAPDYIPESIEAKESLELISTDLSNKGYRFWLYSFLPQKVFGSFNILPENPDNFQLIKKKIMAKVSLLISAVNDDPKIADSLLKSPNMQNFIKDNKIPDNLESGSVLNLYFDFFRKNITTNEEAIKFLGNIVGKGVHIACIDAAAAINSKENLPSNAGSINPYAKARASSFGDLLEGNYKKNDKNNGGKNDLWIVAIIRLKLPKKEEGGYYPITEHDDSSLTVFLPHDRKKLRIPFSNLSSMFESGKFPSALIVCYLNH